MAIFALLLGLSMLPPFSPPALSFTDTKQINLDFQSVAFSNLGHSESQLLAIYSCMFYKLNVFLCDKEVNTSTLQM